MSGRWRGVGLYRTEKGGDEMTPYFQRFEHDSANGIYGDCYRTALACILDVLPEMIPHDHREMKSGCEFPLHTWLKGCGGRLIAIAYIGDCTLSEVLAYASSGNKGLHFLLSGRSTNEVNHVVVCCDGKIVHNPHPGADIIGPCTDGQWYVEFVGMTL